MNELDDRLRSHYHGMSLDQHESDELVGMVMPARTDRKGPRTGAARSLQRWGGALPAGILLALLALHHGTVTERTPHVVSEAAMNHSTELDMEFTTASVHELNAQMRLLPFDIALPEHLGRQYRLIGARYCSISSHLAVHLKLLDRTTDQLVSLFATGLFDRLARIDHERESLDGVTVALFQKGELFYALAQSRLP